MLFQLEDGNSLFDYDVGLNDIIQLMVRPLPTHSDSPQPPKAASNGTTTHTDNSATQNGNGIVQNGNGTTQNGNEGSGSEEEEEESIGVYKVNDFTA